MEGRPPCDLLGLGGRDVGDQAADIGTGGHGRSVARGCTPPKLYPPKRGNAVGLFGILRDIICRGFPLIPLMFEPNRYTMFPHS